ncbi:NAD(P)/FAD-dependent oxidoreductase [Piscinibacter sakaiensis]|uniref:NAD(P)/FAD-dependent oxidoreductase n=1 Tax=Piscinibacter sakaiensis TaxID=1547922 RepID=UPI003AAE7065
MRRIAVVGSGISGLSVAYHLAAHPELAQVTLFEAGDYFGGHTHTVDVEVDTPDGRRRHGVDTGFLVFNERTYPRLIDLFAKLQVETAESEMSFSVKLPDADLEWSGSNLDTVFAQRRNLLRPAFLRMLGEVVRFNRLCTGLADACEEAALQQPIGDFLDQHRFGSEFRSWYFLPMIGCIWSCPTEQMLRFPVATMIRFCHNHGLLQIANRPRWFTVRGGARNYVERMLAVIDDARLNTPVRAIRRLPGAGGFGSGGVLLATDHGSERFDDVVLACHSDQSLAMLADPTEREQSVLGAIRYHPNRAVLHTDFSLLPNRRRAWAAWNYEHVAGRGDGAVCLHYLINRLQPLPFEQPVLVSLNPLREPRSDLVQGSFDYAHPVFDQAAIAAQRRVPEIQGIARTWYCGAWTRYGFHEDGLMSGLGVVDGLLQQLHSGIEREAA